MMLRARGCPSKVIWLSAVVVFLSGCAGLGTQLRMPRVTLADFQVQEVKPFETAFRIELRVFNTTDVAIEIKGVDCELELSGKKFASGVSNVKTTIASYETGTVPVVVYSSVLDMVKGALGLQNKEKLQYSIRGGLYIVTEGLAPSVIPFKSDGELSFGRIANEG